MRKHFYFFVVIMALVHFIGGYSLILGQNTYEGVYALSYKNHGVVYRQVSDNFGIVKNGDSIKVGLKDPVLAGIYSGILPGLGQYYNGQIGKGILYGTIFVVGRLTTWGIFSMQLDVELRMLLIVMIMMKLVFMHQ